MDKEKTNLKIDLGYIYPFLFAAVICTYIAISWQSIHAPFASLDDIGQLYFVREFTGWKDILLGDLFNFFRPVKNILFVAFNYLSNYNIALARLLAISIGIFSFIPVNILCRRILGNSRLFGLTAAAVWLLSPTIVSSTVWLSCVNIMLATGLASASLIFYLNSKEYDHILNPALILSWLFGFLAMLSYEGVVSLAGIYFALEFFLYPAELGRRRTWLRLVSIWSSLALYLLIRMLVIDGLDVSGEFANVSNLQISFSSVYFVFLHIYTWLWPFGRQAVVGTYHWGMVSPFILSVYWLAIFLAVPGLLFGRKRWPVASLGVVWFLLAFMPMSNLIPLRSGPYGDYYLTFAGIGLAILVTSVIRALLRVRGRMRIVASVFIAILACWRIAAVAESFAWSRRWNSEFELYKANVDTFPKAYNALNKLAPCYYDSNQFDEGLELADRSLEIYADQKFPYIVKALVASKRGNIKEAEGFAEKILTGEVQEEHIQWAWNFKGYLNEEYYKDIDKAVDCYEKVLAVESRTWSAAKLQSASALALIKAQKGDLDAAIDLWEQVARITPDDAKVHNNLSIAYRNIGNGLMAEKHKNTYLRLIAE